MKKIKGLTGIEPVTYRSAVGCSTTELKARLTDIYATICLFKCWMSSFENLPIYPFQIP